ncbi:hypothetical protein K4902_32205 [Streptomyces lateritius]|nr:hypothetical protein [Streptomyces lateritius]
MSITPAYGASCGSVSTAWVDSSSRRYAWAAARSLAVIVVMSGSLSTVQR